MRSPASRAGLERGLRAAAFALLAFCAWALRQPAHSGPRSPVPGPQVNRLLPRWTRARPGDSVHLALGRAPEAVQRDWLRALAATGTVLTWSGAIPATAVEVVPLADPAGGVRVLAAAPAGAWAVLGDALGALDSVRVRRAGAAFTLAAHQGALRLVAGGQPSLAAGAAAPAPRHAVVLGRAEWESRFVMAALEERGWTVAARLSVAPGIATTSGPVFPLDTARQSVVVVLDSLAGAEAAAVQRYALNGGGVVLGAAGARALPGLAAGAVGPHVGAPILTFIAATPRRALALDPVLPRRDAVVLERQGGHVVLAARRVGAGRVVQVGYDETWRWRMSNLRDAVDAHREWWASAVSAAAYRGSGVRGQGSGDRGPESGVRDPGTTAAGADLGSLTPDPSPLASLVAAIGPAQPESAVRQAGFDPLQLLAPAATLLLLCLIAEWASRRLRGAA